MYLFNFVVLHSSEYSFKHGHGLIDDVHLWCDVLKYFKYNSPTSDKLLNEKKILILLTGISSALDLLSDKIWMIYYYYYVYLYKVHVSLIHYLQHFTMKHFVNCGLDLYLGLDLDLSGLHLNTAV